MKLAKYRICRRYLSGEVTKIDEFGIVSSTDDGWYLGKHYHFYLGNPGFCCSSNDSFCHIDSIRKFKKI